MSKQSQASCGPSTDHQPVSKRSRQSRDDLSGNIQLPNHTRSKENHVLTEKQAANDQACKDVEIAQLRKQLAHSQKSNEQQRVLLDNTNHSTFSVTLTLTPATFKSAQLMAPPTAPSHTEVGRESQCSNDVTVTLVALPPSLPRVGSDPPMSSVEHLTDNPSVPAAMPLPSSQITGSKGDKLSHYEGWTKTLLHKAMHGYEGHLGAINMCPEEAMQSSWAQEEWRIQFESNEQPIKLSDEMLKLIRKCGVRVRSFMRDQIKPLICPAYDFVAGAKSANAVRENKQKCVELMTALGFYYKVHQPEDATTRTGYFNSPILFDAIGHAFFYNKGAPGLTFPERFNPIPVPALAFIFTVIEHCLDEWSTRSYKALIFNETEASVRYHEHHLPAVKQWTEISPDLTTVLQKAWYTKARKQMGAASLRTPAVPLKLSDSARDLAYEEMKAMAAALDEEPQAEGEAEEEAE
ncbi:hypothetical protein ARMGADRAFT_1111965 [Armillaria gallica]|uniref:DUF6532 domain-containing protein n=1 Tax=Armillaria gallica TaxID=47427 RepID=A0A2H3D5R6_ARMGA|nr:hypothetical protein ARMGADRAFT_1111965 [Armillaria gallica]